MSYFNHLNAYQNNLAIITNAEKISYKKLIIYSEAISKKVKERSLVMLICQNSVEAITGYISFVKSNCAVLLFSDKLNKQTFEMLIKKYNPDYIFLSRNKFFSKINYESTFSFRNYELLKKNDLKKHKLYKDLALLMPTSGSMGVSKFVRQSYENINTNINQINNYLNTKFSDCSITTMPMNYTYGLSIIHTHLFKGASIALSEEGLMSKNFWELFKKSKVNNFGGVPYIYEILKKLNFKSKNFENLEYITQAGGKLSDGLSIEFIEICKNKKLQMFFMYGQTEATARMSYLSWDMAEKKLGSIGKPIKGGKFYLKNSKGELIKKSNEVGELVYEGKNVSLGYSENYKDLERGDDNKGVISTGDLAKKDKDEFYYIVGRSKRFVKSFGVRVNLDDLENLIGKIGYTCACIGDDEKIKIFITNSFKNDELIEKISNITKIHKSGIQLLPIKEIPRNNAGKISYSELN